MRYVAVETGLLQKGDLATGVSFSFLTARICTFWDTWRLSAWVCAIWHVTNYLNLLTKTCSVGRHINEFPLHLSTFQAKSHNAG